MPRYENGRVPSDALVTLDSGNGRHLATPTTAIRWYLLRRNVKERTGVTLAISPGMNGYRNLAEQVTGRRNACAAGNCNAAASPGYSSHGGTWKHPRHTGGRWVDAMAYDIGNFWAIDWEVFEEECAKVGLRTGLITEEVAGIFEGWHVIDLDPYGPAPHGLTLIRGEDGVHRLAEGTAAGSTGTPFEPEEDMSQQDVDEIKAAVLESRTAVLQVRDVIGAQGGLNMPTNQTVLANIRTIAKVLGEVHLGQINASAYLFAGGPAVKDRIGSTDSILGLLYQIIGRPITDVDEAALAGALTTNIMSALAVVMQNAGEADLTEIAKAVNDEQDRRARDRLVTNPA